MARSAAPALGKGSARTVPPLIWGPGDTFDRELGERIRAGRFGYFNGGRYPYSVCHVDNACHGAIRAAEHGRGGEAYFLADAETTEARDFLNDRILAAGLTPPTASVPSRVAWLWRELSKVSGASSASAASLP